MYDVVKVIENIKTIYDSNTNLRVLKDFERVFDELDMYVFDNWKLGELVEGPITSKHTVECKFMWPLKEMPDPQAGKRLLDYNCKVTYKKDYLTQPRKIESPDDYRPGTKKGKIDRHPIWIVSVAMPKSLMFDMYKGYLRNVDEEILKTIETTTQPDMPAEAQTDIDTLGDLNEPTT
jgi:hypothetical protein